LRGDRGFVPARTDDPKAIYEWIRQGADLTEFKVAPVLDDEETASVFKTMKF
jgi:hypothetical protein